jgi:cellulose synthase/poly-beta-1,6-N-acetylglucosamine synthase-like glycosyltransferase
MPASSKNKRISILIAARNEEQNIENVLISVANLSYPKEQLEVLIGDDNSTDGTANTVAAFIRDKPYMSLISIHESTGELKGKTNVLVQLIKEATGEYFFFTDADITLPIGWVETMLSAFGHNVGVVVGSTTTKPVSVFARCQGIEWLNVLKFMEFCGRFNIPTTGMGNNMAVSRFAYEAIGGYEQIPFSIVEDYALYTTIIEKGFGFKHLYCEEILAFTEPPENYFRQRKRWVTGGVQSRSPLLIAAFAQTLLLPIICALFLTNMIIGQLLLFVSLSLNIIIGFLSLRKIGLTKWAIHLPIYSIYVIVFWFLQLINFMLPGGLNWKDRKY